MARRDFSRNARVAQEVQRLLTSYLQRELDDEQLRLTTLTHVKVSNDLSHAKIYWRSMLPDIDVKEVQERFKDNAKRLRHHLSKDMHIRKVPALKFVYDESIDHAAHIDSLFEKTRALTKTLNVDASSEEE